MCNSRGAPVNYLDRDHVVRAFQNFYSQSLPYIGIDNPQVGGFLLGLPRPSTFDVGMEFTFGALGTTGWPCPAGRSRELLSARFELNSAKNMEFPIFSNSFEAQDIFSLKVRCPASHNPNQLLAPSMI